MIKKGEIYLADFGKSRDSFASGKKRPVLLFQTDKLNFAIKEEIYQHTLVIPLSTKDDIVTNEFRYQVTKRDLLKEDCFAVCNAICFLDIKYLEHKLTSLTADEIKAIEEIILQVFDIQ
jgi:mRNA-degrading endonuclease toxin of MazEF toxin-antitoxin module